MSVVELFALHSGPLRSNELSIFSRIIKTKYKLLRKSLLRYSLSYLPTTPPRSVVFFIKAIPGGGFFYCSIALYPDRQPVDQATRNPHETAEVEELLCTLQICILQIASKIEITSWLVPSQQGERNNSGDRKEGTNKPSKEKKRTYYIWAYAKDWS